MLFDTDPKPVALFVPSSGTPAAVVDGPPPEKPPLTETERQDAQADLRRIEVELSILAERKARAESDAVSLRLTLGQPAYPERPTSHVDANKHDMDVTDLDKRVQTIVDAAKDLAAEALRVRDQHRAALDMRLVVSDTTNTLKSILREAHALTLDAHRPSDARVDAINQLLFTYQDLFR